MESDGNSGVTSQCRSRTHVVSVCPLGWVTRAGTERMSFSAFYYFLAMSNAAAAVHESIFSRGSSAAAAGAGRPW